MWLLGLLPLLLFAAAFAFISSKAPTAWEWRHCSIAAALIVGCWAALGAESLTVLKALAFWPVLIWWVVPISALIWKLKGREMALRQPRICRDPILLILCGLIGLIVSCTGLVAFTTPPTNWDALSYHLPRQVYWAQQGHVGLFPTNDVRMLSMPPLAEYLGVQLMILSGGDRWVNGIQWFAFLLMAITGSAIARELGLNARMQAFTALLIVSIPTAALQATNAKNDLVTAFLLCAFALWGLRMWREKSTRKADALWLGAAGGLLALSKGTGLIFGLPVAIWTLIALRRVIGWVMAARAFAIASAVAAVLCLGHLARVQAEFGSPVGPVGRGAVPVNNTLHTPRALFSNVLRNAAMHLGSMSATANVKITSAVETIHGWIGLNANDSRTTFRTSGPFVVSGNFIDEDRAKAPVHLLLFGGAVIVLTVRLWSKDQRMLALFLLCPFLGFLLFCFLLKWQEWHSRLHIPLLCLMCPAIAYLFAGRIWAVGALLGVFAAALAMFSVALNQAKPLVGERNIFTTSKRRMRVYPPETAPGLKAIIAAALERNARTIGLVVRPNRCEYTLLYALHNSLPWRPVLVKLHTTWGDADQPAPDLVVAWYVDPGHKMARHLDAYQVLISTNDVAVYLPKGK